MNEKEHIFFTFKKTIAALRSKNGCPWDKKQTLKSLSKYLHQECEELIEAMDSEDYDHICEEAGDLFFILTLLSEICSESDHFTMDDTILGINEKMIRRHPHVFGDVSISSDEELQEQWERIKSMEKSKKRI